MIRAGDLRHSVTIERRSSTQDAAGEPVRTWTLVATRRAAIKRLPGSEVFSAQQNQGRVPTVFLLRWLSGVLPAMRLTSGGKVYNITSARDPDGRLEMLEVVCEELVEETAT